MKGGRLAHSRARRAAGGLALAALATLVVVASLADVLVSRGDGLSSSSLAVVLVHGARSLVIVTAVASSLSLLVGIVAGAVAGFSGGALDRGLSRVVELLSAFPTIVLVALVTAFDPEPNVLHFGLAIAAVRLAEVARLVRVEIIRWSGTDLSLAARAIGASAGGALLRHLGPRLAGVLAQTLVSTIAAVVVVQTLVEFVGLGGRAGAATWGAGLARAVSDGDNTAAVVLMAVTLAVVGSTQVLAEAVREWFDPYAGRATPCAPRS